MILCVCHSISVVCSFAINCQSSPISWDPFRFWIDLLCTLHSFLQCGVCIVEIIWFSYDQLLNRRTQACCRWKFLAHNTQPFIKEIKTCEVWLRIILACYYYSADNVSRFSPNQEPVYIFYWIISANMGMGKLTKTIYSKIASLSQADLKNKIKAVENMIDSMRKNAHFCDVTYSNLQYVSNIWNKFLFLILVSTLSAEMMCCFSIVNVQPRSLSLVPTAQYQTVLNYLFCLHQTNPCILLYRILSIL